MKDRVAVSLSNDALIKLVHLSDVMQMSKSEVVDYLIMSFDYEKPVNNNKRRKYSKARPGRKTALDVSDLSFINSKISNGESITNIAQEFGVSRRTIYNYLNNSSKTVV